MEVTKAYSKLSRTSKIELFAKMVNGYYSFSTFAKDSILDVRLGSTNVLNKKMNVFFGEEIFCLHWNNSLIEKCHDAGGRWKFQENRMPITHINTFIKISSINSFESWLLVIRLVSWQMCSVSFNPPRDTPASTSRSPLPRYLPIFCGIWKKFIVSSISLEEVAIIIKFLIVIRRRSDPIVIFFRCLY